VELVSPPLGHRELKILGHHTSYELVGLEDLFVWLSSSETMIVPQMLMYERPHFPYQAMIEELVEQFIVVVLEDFAKDADSFVA